MPEYDLACVGISINRLGAMSCDALSCIVAAEIVYCYPPTNVHLALMQRLCRKVVNLHESLYAKGLDFEPAYAAIIREVIGSLRLGHKVAYATQGSPVFHCGTCVSVYRAAVREGFRCLMVPGISSFDLICAFLAQEYDLRNVQIVSIPHLHAGLATISPSVPSLLFDLGRFALPAIRLDANELDRQKVQALAGQLRALYPPQHPIVLLFLTAQGVFRHFSAPLSRLEDETHRFCSRHGCVPTLFVPGMETGRRDGAVRRSPDEA